MLSENRGGYRRVVEPVQLQVVCENLWRALLSLKDEKITQKHLQEYGDVNKALSEFYERSIHETFSPLA